MFSLRICFISVSIAGSSRSRLRCVRFTICVTPSCGSQCLRVKCVWNVRAHPRDHHGAIDVQFFLMWSIRQMPHSLWLAWQQAHKEATWRQCYTHVVLVLPVGMKLRKRLGRLLYYVVSITAANCLICYCFVIALSGPWTCLIGLEASFYWCCSIHLFELLIQKTTEDLVSVEYQILLCLTIQAVGGRASYTPQLFHKKMSHE